MKPQIDNTCNMHTDNLDGTGPFSTYISSQRRAVRHKNDGCAKQSNHNSEIESIRRTLGTRCTAIYIARHTSIRLRIEHHIHSPPMIIEQQTFNKK